MFLFLWEDWNTDHIAKHAVSIKEAEYIVRQAKAPFPREIEEDKYVIWGQTDSGRYLEVIFAFRSEQELDYESLTLEDILNLTNNQATIIYVIHSMELTDRMKRQFRKL